MSDSKKPLDQEVLDWLNSQGYPLEMTVAKAFQDAGMHVDQSVYYRDPETDTPREMDIVAGLEDGVVTENFLFSCQFCIECKKSSDSWVVFAATGKLLPSLFINSWICSKIGHSVKSYLPLETGYSHPFYKWNRAFGTGITNASKKSNNDVPYKALLGATKAAFALAQQADSKKWEGSAQPNGKVLFGTMTQPVVVLDGNLFEARLDESGEIKVNEVNESIVLFRYPFSRNTSHGVAVPIVTTAVLDDFAARAADIENAITGCVEAQQKAYHEHYKPQRSLKEMSEAAQASRKQTPDIGDR
ncbi:MULTISPECIES: hypothetical protein [Rhodopirellula]|uniref:hypothetical protein n=1 Tax=Rhodopirellula TaxID=265488 RepID=UPI00257E4141|nr:hypothetical protein [Rhodopirellula sp. UBA1907]